MSPEARGGLVVAVLVVLGLGGWGLWQANQPAPVPAEEAAAAAEAPAEPAPEAPAAPEAAAEAPAAEPAPAPAEAPAEVAAPLAPTIDVLRVDGLGNTTLAGRTEPGAEVILSLDGAQIATVPADGAGQFATVFSLPPADSARLLSLVARLPDGSEIAGAEAAIAPFAGAATAGEAAVAPEVIALTDEGAAVVQSASETPAGIAAEISLEIIAYTAEGAVQLGGHGAAGQSVRLYLDNTELATVAIGADGGWSLISDAIAPGVYTLRLDQIDATGKVTSRLETPFKRETLEALAAAGAIAALPEAEPEPAEAEPEAAAPEATPETTGAEAAPAAPSEGKASETATAPEGTAAEAAPEPAPEPAAPAGPVTVTVLPGYTLWGIAKASYGNPFLYVQVFRANSDKIRDPDLIYPGQVFTIPEVQPAP